MTSRIIYMIMESLVFQCDTICMFRVMGIGDMGELDRETLSHKILIEVNLELIMDIWMIQDIWVIHQGHDMDRDSMISICKGQVIITVSYKKVITRVFQVYLDFFAMIEIDIRKFPL
jgi:hypothetical protein